MIFEDSVRVIIILAIVAAMVAVAVGYVLFFNDRHIIAELEVVEPDGKLSFPPTKNRADIANSVKSQEAEKLAESGVVPVARETPNVEVDPDKIEEINSRINAVIASEVFCEASTEQRKAQMEGLLMQLSKENLITDVSFDEYANVFSFDYFDATLGGVLIEDLVSVVN